MINNECVPVNTAARQHYFIEVGRRQLHPLRTPLQTPNSRVSIQVLHAIYERFFLSMTNNQCIPTYNSYGGNATRDASISKALLLEAWKWFEAENVILPWAARKDDDKKRLKALGLAPNNFPSPHAAADPLAKKSKPSSSATTVQMKEAKQKPAEQSIGVIGYDEPEEDSDDDDDSKPSHVLRYYDPNVPSSPLYVEETWIEDEENTERYKVRVVKKSRNVPSIHGIMRAATNAFNIGEDPRVALIARDRRCLISRNARYMHCSYVSAIIHEEKDYRDIDFHSRKNPIIVRALIQCISPTPSTSLPKFDIKFANLDSFVGYGDSGPLGIVDMVEHSKAREIVWDIDACAQLHELAVAMGCTVVKDMVIERIYKMYGNEVRRKKARPESDVEDFELPFYHFTRLSLDKDAAFIRCIGGIHCARASLTSGDDCEIEWPTDVSDETIGAVVVFYSTCMKEGRAEPGVATCRRYHTHTDDELCFKLVADGHNKTTRGMISRLFTELRKEAFKANSEALEDLQEKEPDNRQAHKVLSFQREMM
jgi:hypothetical protein